MKRRSKQNNNSPKPRDKRRLELHWRWRMQTCPMSLKEYQVGPGNYGILSAQAGAMSNTEEANYLTFQFGNLSNCLAAAP